MLVSLHVTHFIRNGLIGWENISYKNVLSELPYVKSFKYQECRQFGHLNSKKLFFFFFVKIFIGVHVIYIQNTIYLFRIHTVIIFASVVIRICHEIFQFFFTACVCVRFIEKSEWTNSKAVGMECVKLKWMMSDVVCAHTCTCTRLFVVTCILYACICACYMTPPPFIHFQAHFLNEFFKWEKKMCQTINKLWLTASWLKKGSLIK